MYLVESRRVLIAVLNFGQTRQVALVKRRGPGLEETELGSIGIRVISLNWKNQLQHARRGWGLGWKRRRRLVMVIHPNRVHLSHLRVGETYRLRSSCERN